MPYRSGAERFFEIQTAASRYMYVQLRD